MWPIRNCTLPLICPESSTDSPSTIIGPSASPALPPIESKYRDIPTSDDGIRRKVAQVGQLLGNIEFDAQTLRVTLPLKLRWKMKDLKNQRDYVVKVYGDQLKFFPNESPSLKLMKELGTLDLMKQTVETMYHDLKLSDEWVREASKCRPQEPDYSTDESLISSPPIFNNAAPTTPSGVVSLAQDDSSDTGTLVELPVPVVQQQPSRPYEDRQNQPAPSVRSAGGGPSRAARYTAPFLRPMPYYPAQSSSAAASSTRASGSISTRIHGTHDLQTRPNMTGRIPQQQQQQHSSSNAIYQLDTQGRPIPAQTAATSATIRRFVQMPRVVPSAAPAPQNRPNQQQQGQLGHVFIGTSSSQPLLWNPAQYARLPTEYPPLPSTYDPRPYHHARR